MKNLLRLGKSKTNKVFLLLVFLLICISSFAQKDSSCKSHFTINLVAATISGEVGFYYDYRLSDKIGLQLSYGHRFYSFNTIHNGGAEGYGLSYIIFPQRGDIIRIGLKKHFRFKQDIVRNRSTYLTSRLSYWNLHTPKYTHLIDGVNGYSTAHREIISVDKNVLNAAIGIGKEINFKKLLFLDLFYCIGVSIGQKKTHKYSSGDYNAERYIYPPNTFVKTLALFPTIELGFKLGFGW